LRIVPSTLQLIHLKLALLRFRQIVLNLRVLHKLVLLEQLQFQILIDGIAIALLESLNASTKGR